MNLRDLDDTHPPSPSHSHSLSHFSLSHRNSTGSFNQLEDCKTSLFQTATRSRSTPSLSELRLEEARQTIQTHSITPPIHANRNVLVGLGMLSGLDDANNSGVEVRMMAKDRLATAPKALEFEAECQCKKHPHVPSQSSASSAAGLSSDEGLAPSRISSCPACTFEKDETVPFPPTVSPFAFRSESFMRSGPSAIIPDCLYLGGYHDASNLHALLERNIGVVINVTAEVSNFFPRKLVYYKYFFVDLPTQSISHVFDEISSIIDDYIYTHKKAVLVHCFAGVSRSASVVIAYLMKSHPGMTYENAYQFVKERRKIINPNEGFRKQLQEYEHKLKQQENDNCTLTQFPFIRAPISPKKIRLPVIADSSKEKENGTEVDSVNGLVNVLGSTHLFNFPVSGSRAALDTNTTANSDSAATDGFA